MSRCRSSCLLLVVLLMAVSAVLWYVCVIRVPPEPTGPFTLDYSFKGVRIEDETATIDYHFKTRYLMKLPSGDKWQVTNDINRMNLVLENKEWKVLSGL